MWRGEGDHREDSIEMIFLGQDWGGKIILGQDWGELQCSI